jgi:hypothetical protein
MGQGPFKPRQYTGSATKNTTVINTPLQIQNVAMIHGAYVSNTDAAVGLGISFDNGQNFFTVPPNTVFWIDDIVCVQFWVLSTKAAHTFNLILKEG